jgi:hypothetical protein
MSNNGEDATYKSNTSDSEFFLSQKVKVDGDKSIHLLRRVPSPKKLKRVKKVMTPVNEGDNEDYDTDGTGSTTDELEKSGYNLANSATNITEESKLNDSPDTEQRDITLDHEKSFSNESTLRILSNPKPTSKVFADSKVVDINVIEKQEKSTCDKEVIVTDVEEYNEPEPKEEDPVELVNDILDQVHRKKVEAGIQTEKNTNQYYNMTLCLFVGTVVGYVIGSRRR